MSIDIKEINDHMERIKDYFEDAESGNKAAGARMRKSSLELERALKNLRQYSLKAHR
jgi:hypothetical protein